MQCGFHQPSVKDEPGLCEYHTPGQLAMPSSPFSNDTELEHSLRHMCRAMHLKCCVEQVAEISCVGLHRKQVTQGAECSL